MKKIVLLFLSFFLILIELSVPAIPVEAERISEETVLYIDNMRVYSGDEIVTDFPQKAYCSDIEDTLDPGDDFGDYTFFNNHYCYTGPNETGYPNFTAVPKTNEIVCHRLIDYTNPEREDYIYLNQTDTANDCYFDVSCTLPDWVANPNRNIHIILRKATLKKIP